MKIYVTMVKFLYDHDEIVSTHLTRKGALIHIIETMTGDLCGGIDPDELEECRTDMPHNPEQDLMCYSGEQLAGIFSDWLEYSHDMIEHMAYEWFETEVQV